MLTSKEIVMLVVNFKETLLRSMKLWELFMFANKVLGIV